MKKTNTSNTSNTSKRLTVLLSMLVLLSACNGTAEDKQEDKAQDDQVQMEISDQDGTKNQVKVDVTSGITEAVEQVDEAVVSVLNMKKGSNLDNYGYIFDFYNIPKPEDSGELEEAGSGSGVIYKTDGGDAYVVTNNHVVDGSDAIEVLFMNGEKVQAEIIGTDVWTDLAVLKIPSSPVTKVAQFGDSDNLTVGEPAIAIGSPLGTEFASSVTSGIISGKERSVPVDINNDGQKDWEASAIQTDAAINPGNSGGALVNIQGQLIGINSMKISDSQIEGMGFAIPSNEVKSIVGQLEANGEVNRPFLGISFVDLSMVSEEDKARTLSLPENVVNGVVINQVEANSPAAKANLKPYDAIVSYNGKEVSDSLALRKLIYSTEVGSKVEIEYYRKGKLEKVTVTMDAAEKVR